ncbi:MAG: hypothetical protein K6G91_13490 [Kiritimatiellae bacterium]|nr:hypothetical protein [Kiritimatiellia bacterium]
MGKLKNGKINFPGHLWKIGKLEEKSTNQVLSPIYTPDFWARKFNFPSRSGKLIFQEKWKIRKKPDNLAVSPTYTTALQPKTPIFPRVWKIGGKIGNAYFFANICNEISARKSNFPAVLENRAFPVWFYLKRGQRSLPSGFGSDRRNRESTSISQYERAF